MGTTTNAVHDGLFKGARRARGRRLWLASKVAGAPAARLRRRGRAGRWGKQMGGGGSPRPEVAAGASGHAARAAAGRRLGRRSGRGRAAGPPARPGASGARAAHRGLYQRRRRRGRGPGAAGGPDVPRPRVRARAPPPQGGPFAQSGGCLAACRGRRPRAPAPRCRPAAQAARCFLWPGRGRGGLSGWGRLGMGQLGTGPG